MQKELPLDATVLETLVSAAVAAPSIHNTQPWHFHADEVTRTIEVRADLRRSLPITDPSGRALHLSVGAAVFNLRVAAAHLGWDPVLHLLPRAGDPGLLATVRLAGPPRTPPSPGPDLYESIGLRHSSRLPFTDRPVPGIVLDELVEAARTQGAGLTRPGAAESARLFALTADAELRRTMTPARLAETRSWLTDSNEGPFGIPYDALGPGDAGGRIPVRDFTGLERGHHQPPEHFEEHPRLLLLATRDDHPADWLRAGQALERVLLLATFHGMRASMLYQALEWADLRWLLRDPTMAGESEPQMLLRIGYGPQGPATPRRAARDAMV